MQKGAKLYLSNSQVFKLRGQGEHSEELDLAERGFQQLVVCSDCLVGTVVMAGDATQFRALNLPRLLVIFYQVIFIKGQGRRVNQVFPPLLKQWVVFERVMSDTI